MHFGLGECGSHAVEILPSDCLGLSATLVYSEQIKAILVACIPYIAHTEPALERWTLVSRQPRGSSSDGHAAIVSSTLIC